MFHSYSMCSLSCEFNLIFNIRFRRVDRFLIAITAVGKDLFSRRLSSHYHESFTKSSCGVNLCVEFSFVVI